MKPALPADAAPLALDAGALSALKQQARSSPKAALSAAASQFEALFVQMLLKSMRDALPQDGLLQSDTSKQYTAMFDQQIAQSMSKRGIGLREVLERQLAPVLGAEDPTAAARTAVGKIRGADAGEEPAAPRPARAPASRVANADAPGSVGVDHAVRRAADAAKAGSVHAAADAGLVSRVPANVRAFIEKMRPHAEAAARAVGVPADLLLAQAGLETGWGRSQPKSADGTASHNLFGLKAGRSWNGAVAVAATTEYVAGAVVRTVERFRSYGSYTEAFHDFGKLLTGSGRYASAVSSTTDPVAYARGLQRGGYATDPHYADKLLRAIRMVATAGASTPAQVIAGAAVKSPDRA